MSRLMLCYIAICDPSLAIVQQCIIPKALECNKRTLRVFAKDLLISEDLLIYPFSPPPKKSHMSIYVENGGIEEQIA
ncbi:hypothetical protein TNCV_648651 [Trichonephila clavipes]|uniref:Uncharacterized protein n=1 Tax=Trichonephila clavipes TaxID=2585209 RepID=A0A8X6SJE2_TRICX|nr:hypothetical protein TNCV_648651 [Trichonephila clavipes]